MVPILWHMSVCNLNNYNCINTNYYKCTESNIIIVYTKDFVKSNEYLKYDMHTFNQSWFQVGNHYWNKPWAQGNKLSDAYTTCYYII